MQSLKTIILGSLLCALSSTTVGWIIYCGLEATSVQGYEFKGHLILMVFGLALYPVLFAFCFVILIPLSAISFLLKKANFTHKTGLILFTPLTLILSLSYLLMFKSLNTISYNSARDKKISHITHIGAATSCGITLALYYRPSKNRPRSRVLQRDRQAQ